METIAYEQNGSVGWLRLNRPDRLNAMTFEMWGELAELGARLRDDPTIRALVVIGNGRSFSSGIDLSSFSGGGGPLFSEAGTQAQPPALAIEDKLVAGIGDVQEAYAWLAEAPYPTIAAVRGHALGGGAQLALACDLRIFARGTKFGLFEHRYGIMPDLGGTYWLPRIVGAAKAKELIWTADQIDADECYRIGLVNRLVDDEELDATATALADQLAAAPPLAVAGTKRAVGRAADQSLQEGLLEAAIEQAACIRSKDFLEAVAALMEKRAPSYQGH
jgi:enoyl-CoA hydratase/carnithine racemase